MEGETDCLPDFYHARIKQQLGPMYGLLPEGALRHDHTAYLKSASAPVAVPAAVKIQPRLARRPAPGRGEDIQPTL
jgi:hypothetical protein